MSSSVIRATLAAATLIIGVLSPAQAVPSSVPLPCVPLLAANAHGRAAIDAAGSRMSEIAALNNTTSAELTERLRSDDSFWIDRCGMGFYVEPITATASPVVFTPTANDYAQTFLLHSKPGSNRTIYLDFTGETVTGTAWNSSYNGGAAWYAPPFSSDTDTAFSNSEQDIIQSVWQRVSEDYAPFDVDVTTEPPAAGVIERTSSTDLIYGTRALITNDTLLFNQCGCGGIAYVGTFDNNPNTTYMPAFVFKNGLGANAKNLAEATSHEVGHNLGLSHDGLSTAGYYYGRLGWAPIMGVGYNESVVQWSKGEYPDANMTQDDYAVMATNGAIVRADEDSNTATTARAIDPATTQSGVIASPTDVDWFSFTPASTGTYTFTAIPQLTSPNLDMALELYEGVTRIDVANAPFVRTGTDVASGLAVNLGAVLQAGTTYTVKIDGVGSGTLNTGGFTDYGSLGNYLVSVAAGANALAFGQIWNAASATAVPNATVGVGYSRQLAVVGGVQPYASWVATGLPAWLSMGGAGLLTGTASGTGTDTFTVTVTDAVGTSISRVLSIARVAAPTITSTSLPGALAATAYSATVVGAGGTTAYRWTATGVPAGMTFNIGTGAFAGTPSTAGTYTVSVTLTDATGVIATRNLTLNVASAALAITAKTLASATQNNVYSATEAATGGATPYSWSATGLPAGLAIDTNTGTISGTPTAAGSFSVALRVADPYGRVATATQALTVAPSSVLGITTTTLPNGTVGAAYSSAITAAGGTTPYTWTASGLPSGFTMNSGTGAITGVTDTSGTYTVTVTVSDASSGADSKTLSLTIAPAPLAITTNSLASGTLAVAYSVTLSGSGGTAPYAWSATGLPGGLGIDSSTGVISGTPSASGTFSVVLTLTDAGAPQLSATKTLSLVISAGPLTITTTSLSNGTVGVRYSASLAASGGSGTKTWSLAAGSLPTGLKLSSTGVISGSPKKRATSTFTVRVTDGSGSATKQFTITVQ